MNTIESTPDSLFARMAPSHTLDRGFAQSRGAAVLELLKDAPLSEKDMFPSFGKEPGAPHFEALSQFSTLPFLGKKNLFARFLPVALRANNGAMKADITPQEPDNNDWWYGLLGTIALAAILGAALAHGNAGW